LANLSDRLATQRLENTIDGAINPQWLAMAFTMLAVIGAAVAIAVYTGVSGLQKNLATARKTGFAYLVVRKWHLHLLHACIQYSQTRF
jgi:hypothetical protein